MKTLYTIGHSNLRIDDFINLLNTYDINSIVDVRSTPYSRYTPQYNRENLKVSLKKYGVAYIGMAKEFGARRDNRSLYHDEGGYLDFELVYKDEYFLKGVQRIDAGISLGYKIALMCTERDAIDCHRNIMIARYFHRQGYAIVNVKHDESSELQHELEERLLDKYFPRRDSISIFEVDNINRNEMIKKAYNLRNKEIGHRL